MAEEGKRVDAIFDYETGKCIYDRGVKIPLEWLGEHVFIPMFRYEDRNGMLEV